MRSGSPYDARRFARHLLLAEVGERGQASLCAHAVRVAGDARAVEVATMYLERAGIIVACAPPNADLASPPLPPAGGVGGGSASGTASSERIPPPNPLPQAGEHAIDVGSERAIAALAGRAELESAAAFVAGAFAAVEAIKRALDVGRPGQLDGVSLSGPEDA